MSRITEQIQSFFTAGWWTGLRSRFGVFGSKLWPARPAYDGSIINYNQARSLYRNADTSTNLGAGFAKPIIDLSCDFTGQPTATVQDANDDDFLNECLHIYWADVLDEMKRNAMRDSKTIVRIRQPFLIDPLITMADREHCFIEIVDPDRCEFEYNIQDSSFIEKALIVHYIPVVSETVDPPAGLAGKTMEHEIVEVITPESFRYYDRTENRWLDTWEAPNNWAFVPLVEVYNEYDSTLSGGQSDLETALPFIKAFHDVMTQAIQANKYHSTPKLRLHLNEVGQFLKNNFPDAVDSVTGEIKAGTEITWTGREVIFLQVDEKAEFLEAKSVLGDTKLLLDFLFDCICVASETPRWAFMTVPTGAANQETNAQTLPWVKKIERKRREFSPPVQRLLKMAMAINNLEVRQPKITWDIIRVADLATYNQALQQLIMGLEVAKQGGIISDETYREMLRMFIPVMKNPEQEAKDARSNLAAATQVQQAASNGKGNPNNVPQPALASGQQGKNE